VAREDQTVELADDGGLRVVRLDARFLEDHLALGVDLFRSERRAERHRVEELEGGAGSVARHQDLEGRVVERRERVVAAALTLDDAVDVPRAEGVRSLEEHVLLEVRVAQAVGRLVPDAGADPEVDGDDVTGAVILDEEHETLGSVSTVSPGAGAAAADMPPPAPAPRPGLPRRSP